MNKKEVEKLARENFTRIGQAIFEICNSYYWSDKKFKKKIKSGETYQIKICTKYKTKSEINPLDFFSRLSSTNLAPEAFMIKDNNYSIISCSPENLITKKGTDISTKPIAGTVKKTKYLNKKKALSYFRKNLKETKVYRASKPPDVVHHREEVERRGLRSGAPRGEVQPSEREVDEGLYLATPPLLCPAPGL